MAEEVSIKWMDGPSVTETERGGVHEMEIEISSIHFCDTWSVQPFQVCIRNKFWTSGSGQTENTQIRVFSVNTKWIERPSVTEMDRGDFYFHFMDTSSFHFCDT